ncbi:MAG: S-methyl-5-thioribose-1-phosphate isomerase [Nannocystales bacterium]
MFDAQSYVRPFVLDEAGLTLRVLDQRKLPAAEVWTEPREVEAVAVAIEDLVVRGAPAIACVAALGLAVCVQDFDDDPGQFRIQVEAACVRLWNTRPTAVNLFVALREIREAMAGAPEDADAPTLRALVLQTAKAHAEGDLASCLAMAGHGAPLLPDSGAVLTHCNAGALATAGYGTALGVLRRGREIGKRYTVLADETRPVLQGARLTAWELQHDGVPVEVIADNMAGALMASGVIKAAVVGADRIARNGDVANKIGTYTVAVLCKHHGIPFYVAAPWTTIDRSLASGADIPIEERNPREVRVHGSTQLTPEGVGVRNPAFDVTPASLVTKIITETGNFDPGQIADA